MLKQRPFHSNMSIKRVQMVLFRVDIVNNVWRIKGRTIATKKERKNLEEIQKKKEKRIERLKGWKTERQTGLKIEIQRGKKTIDNT